MMPKNIANTDKLTKIDNSFDIILSIIVLTVFL